MNFYLDNISGVSGDIIVATLLQIKPVFKELNEIVSHIFDCNVTLDLIDTKVSGISVKRLKIDMSSEEKATYRHIDDIFKLLDKANLSDNIIKCIRELFLMIANAESKAHNIPLSEVHFHEIGAVDTIIDIVSAVYLIKIINPGRIVSSPIKIGKGLIRSVHGTLPNPAIATMYLLEGTLVERIDITEELTTPTGAALVKYFVNDFSYTFTGKVLNTFYSTGTKDFGAYPNIFRIVCFEPEMSSDVVCEIETNIDDMSGQFLAYTFEKLFEAGALDVFYTPIYAKKNRPAYKINVICKEDNLDKMSDIIFENTSTAGIRYLRKNRIILERSFETVNYKGFDITIKIFFFKGKKRKTPEWDDIKNISKNLNITPQEVYNSIQQLLL